MKFRAALLTLVLASTTLAISPALSAPLTIGIAYDIGGRGDRSFNDAAAIGLEKAKKKFEFTVEAIVTDGTSIDRERRVRSLIAKNCNPVIAVGSGYAPTIKILAAEFPDTQFAILNDATIEALNVSSLIFSDTQAAYLAGYSAALASKRGKVAMIASNTQADMFHDGFSAGVKAAKKSVTSIIRYVNGSSTAASKLAMDAGADVLFIARPGSNSEIFSQIANRNKAKSKSKGYKQVGMISIEPDQYVTMTSSNRQFLYATVVKHVDKAIYDVITLALSGRQYLDILDAERGIYGHRYNVSDGGITFKTYLPALTSANSLINGAAAQASKIAA